MINPDGSGLRQVSTDPDCTVAFFCSDSEPVWSPDGRYIAFFSGKDQQSGITLDVVNLSTGKQSTLVTNVASVSTFSWASDSKTLAFVAYDAPPPNHVSKIYTVGVEGGQPQKLIDIPGFFADEPSWSPDGRHLLFALSQGDITKWVMSDPDGSNQRVINTDRTILHWSPDSKSILIGNPKTKEMRIVNAANGSDLVSMTLPIDNYVVNWSPDGQSILLEWYPRDTLNTKFSVLDVQSKAIHEITAQPAEYQNPTWSPNSKYVIVEADSVGTGALNGLYIINVEDKSIQQFMDGGNFEPTWSANANLANEAFPIPTATTAATSTPENGNPGQSALSVQQNVPMSAAG
ncbi:MAG: TolB family protein [Aggregatilineales bacterium]